jgi:hypothetical protein
MGKLAAPTILGLTHFIDLPWMPSDPAPPQSALDRSGKVRTKGQKGARSHFGQETRASLAGKPRLIAGRNPGGVGVQARLEIGEEWILFGGLSSEESKQLRKLIRSHLRLWADPLEVWVPTPKLLFRLTHSNAPELSSIQGFRKLCEFQPLVNPTIEDPSLWTRTTLGSQVNSDMVFGVCRGEGGVRLVFPLEGRAYFQFVPRELAEIEPGLFGALGIDRFIDFLRGVQHNGLK